ncbi:MAG: glycoside hydrolase family 95 protein, partial [Planctomycetota bacterium]
MRSRQLNLRSGTPLCGNSDQKEEVANGVKAKNLKRKAKSQVTRNSVVFAFYLAAFSLFAVRCAMADVEKLSVHGNGSDTSKWRDLKLWYHQPAQEWTQALPVGNGRLGTMVFGGTEHERLQFNEETLWTGQPREYHHDGAVEYLPIVRKLLFEGKQRQAEELAAEHMMSVPLRQEKYQPFGDLHLHLPSHDKASDYRRELDIDAGIARVHYHIGEVTFTREVFSSFPDQVIVVHLTCSEPGQLTFTAMMDSPHPQTRVLVVDKNMLALRGCLREYTSRRLKQQMPSVLKFEARLGWQAQGGKVRVINDALE